MKLYKIRYYYTDTYGEFDIKRTLGKYCLVIANSSEEAIEKVIQQKGGTDHQIISSGVIDIM